MSSLDLPSEYDVVVLGTGMTESIVAAALSRAGMSVLHLDRYDYYSGDWACFHFEGFQDWIKSKQGAPGREQIEVKCFPQTLIGDGETSVNLCVNSNSVRNIEEKTFIREDLPQEAEIVMDSTASRDVSVVEDSEEVQDSTDTHKTEGIVPPSNTVLSTDCTITTEEQMGQRTVAPDNETDDAGSRASKSDENVLSDKEVSEGVQKVQRRKTWVFSEIKKLWRKFNIDLMPKVLFCRGPMVELLISSDVAKYCEFKTVSRVLTKLNGKLEQVPCSRSDVFGSKLVSMIEKRMMMKYLTFCLEYEKHEESYIDFKDKPYKEYLQSQKLTPNIQHFIQHSIAMVTDDTSTIEGLKATHTFLQSLGRYGNTAFLWPMYGSGELPQCFCRMCAVFGGVYCLRRTAQVMVVDSQNRCQAVIDTEGQRLSTKWLVLEASFASDPLLSSLVKTYTCRAILLTDRSLSAEPEGHITLLSLPVQGLPSPVTLLELPPSASCSPEGLYLVHLSCVCQHGAQRDLHTVIEDLFVKADQEDTLSPDCTKPRIQWAVYFEVADTTQCTKHPDSPTNVFVVGGPNHCLDFAYSVEKAKQIFSQICPDQEFLPKAPNPEDIIWDDGGESQPSGGGFGEEGGASNPGEAGSENNTETASDTSENKGSTEVSECKDRQTESESREVEDTKSKQEQSECRATTEVTECEEVKSESREVEDTKSKQERSEYRATTEVTECDEVKSESESRGQREVTKCKGGESQNSKTAETK